MLFPTGISWRTAKERARAFQKSSGLNYTKAFIQVAEDNAVVLPTMDGVRTWLNERQPLILKYRITYVPPEELGRLARERQFVLTHRSYHPAGGGSPCKAWWYTHVVPCSACQHDNHGAIVKDAAADCMACEGAGFTLIRAHGRDGDNLNFMLLTPVMRARLREADAQPTAQEMARDFFPEFMVRNSSLEADLAEEEERQRPDLAWNGRGAEDPDNVDLYENPDAEEGDAPEEDDD